MVDEELRADCAVLGIDPNRLIPPAQQRDRPQDFELWPEHQEAWGVYLGCATQWRLSVGVGGLYWQGLDYQGVDVVMRRYRVPRKRQDAVFAELQVLEDEEKAIRNRR